MTERHMRLVINNQLLVFQSSAKNLEIILDNELKFKTHISKLIHKPYGALKMFYSNHHVLYQLLKKQMAYFVYLQLM